MSKYFQSLEVEATFSIVRLFKMELIVFVTLYLSKTSFCIMKLMFCEGLVIASGYFLFWHFVPYGAIIGMTNKRKYCLFVSLRQIV